MKLEIDIDEDYYKIICKRVEENKPYHSPYEYEAIADGKPLEQEPKTGHWILTDVEGYRVWHCNCSECGKDPQDYVGGSENWWLIRNNLPKFCPNCGADMREVEE